MEPRISRITRMGFVPSVTSAVLKSQCGWRSAEARQRGRIWTQQPGLREYLATPTRPSNSRLQIERRRSRCHLFAPHFFATIAPMPVSTRSMVVLFGKKMRSRIDSPFGSRVPTECSRRMYCFQTDKATGHTPVPHEIRYTGCVFSLKRNLPDRIVRPTFAGALRTRLHYGLPMAQRAPKPRR